MEITKLFLISSVFSFYYVQYTHGYRILGIFPHSAKSHFIFTSAVMKSLAAAGHEVVVISAFPQSTPIKNYKDISLLNTTGRTSSSFPIDVDSLIPPEQTVSSLPVELVTGRTVIPTLAALYVMGIQACEKALSYPEIHELSNERFDAVMVELFNTDCFLPIANKFKVPIISLSSSVIMPWGTDRFGLPDNPSYIPCHFLAHADKMAFVERLWNTVSIFSTKLFYSLVIDTHSSYVARKYLGSDIPPLSDIARNTSLLLINTHISINQPRPLLPNVIEVGGLHIQPPKEIPKEFKNILDESKHGVIYFSFGSTVRVDTFTEDMRKSFMEAFSELPYDVLFKWESESLPGQPKNVKIAKWMPQLEILSHPKVKVFITHGGLMGSTEALYFGIPMVCIPLFGDQHLNARSYVEEGMAVSLSYFSLSKDSILNALEAVLHNKSYADNAKRASQAYRDRPMSPADTVVYWTEYVIRHKGAPHLRSAALDLYWFQYLLLDVILVIFVIFSAIIFISYLTIRAFIRCLFGKRESTKQQTKSAKKKKKA